MVVSVPDEMIAAIEPCGRVRLRVPEVPGCELTAMPDLQQRVLSAAGDFARHGDQARLCEDLRLITSPAAYTGLGLLTAD